MCSGTGAYLKEPNVFCSKVFKRKAHPEWLACEYVIFTLRVCFFGLNFIHQYTGLLHFGCFLHYNTTVSYITHNVINKAHIGSGPCVIYLKRVMQQHFSPLVCPVLSPFHLCTRLKLLKVQLSAEPNCTILLC